VARNTSNKIEEKRDDSFSLKTLGPWLVVAVVLICGAIALVFYYGQDKQAARPPGAGRRCWVGIDVSAMNPIVAREFKVPFEEGVLVDRVFAGSPADRAGVQRGDIIYRINNRRVKDTAMAWSFLAGGKSGESVDIMLYRMGVKKTCTLTLEPEPANLQAMLSPPKGPQASLAVQPVALNPVPTGTLPSPRQQNAAKKTFIEGHWLGLETIPLTAELATEYKIPKGEKGVLVDEVTLEAAESGILAGDMVQSIEGFPTPDLKAFFFATQQVQKRPRAQVKISRRGHQMAFTMTARNTNILGFAQMEAAQPIQPGALRPHRYMGSCTRCHVFMRTGGQLATDAGDILPSPPPITRNATPSHRDRGQCAACHTIR
jgi:hypothetical protein